MVTKRGRGSRGFGVGDAKGRARHQHILLAMSGRTARVTKHYCKKVNKLKSELKSVVPCKMKKRKCRLCYKEILKMAFDKRKNRHALSDRYEVSRATVMRMLQVGASTVLEVQLKQLQALCEFAEAKKPHFGCVSLMWDETGERLALQPVKQTQLQAQSTWQILVSRIQFGIGWTHGVKIYHEMVMPPVPLISNACSHIFNGIFRHSLVAPITSLVWRLLAACDLRVCVFETDGHLANEKLASFQIVKETQKPNSQQVLLETMLCQNHGINLSIVHIVNSTISNAVDGNGKLLGKLLQNMFCAALFLRMGAHFCRLQASVHHLVHRADVLEWIPFQDVRSAALRRQGQSFAEELSSYLIDNLHHHSKGMALYEDSYTAQKQMAHNIKHCFTHVLNGPYWRRGKVVHVCTHRDCCATIEDVKEKVIQALLRVVFRKAPILPMLADWCKIGPSMDFFVAVEHQGLLSLLLDHSQWAFKFEQQASASASSGSLDPDCELEWHALAGRRFQRARRSLACNWANHKTDMIFEFSFMAQALLKNTSQ